MTTGSEAPAPQSSPAGCLRPVIAGLLAFLGSLVIGLEVTVLVVGSDPGWLRSAGNASAALAFVAHSFYSAGVSRDVPRAPVHNSGISPTATRKVAPPWGVVRADG